MGWQLSATQAKEGVRSLAISAGGLTGAVRTWPLGWSEQALEIHSSPLLLLPIAR